MSGQFPSKKISPWIEQTALTLFVQFDQNGRQTENMKGVDERKGTGIIEENQGIAVVLSRGGCGGHCVHTVRILVMVVMVRYS